MNAKTLIAGLLTTLAAGLFIIAFALFYGSTLAPSPRDGVQPVEAKIGRRHVEQPIHEEAALEAARPAIGP